MTDPKNQLHAAGTRRTAVPPRLKDPKACSNAFGDNPVRVLVPLLEFNLCVIAGKPAVWFGFWLSAKMSIEAATVNASRVAARKPNLSARTTGLYDRRGDEVSIEEVDRIGI